ncbi:MAG: hypothetical protein ABI461_19240, partial [Polyangiaceae bacterium]
PEEREAIRARIVRRLAAIDAPAWSPWSDDKMRTLADRVSAGKLRENGPVCARPPTLSEVVDAETNGGADPNLVVATPSLDCDGHEECMIQVSIGGLEGEREADLMLSSKVTSDSLHDGVDAWLTAADALDTVDELVGSGYGFGGGSAPPFVRATVRRALGDFGSTFAAAPVLPPARALAACHDATTSRRADLDYDVLASIDDAGQVTKCVAIETGPLRDATATKREPCICQAVQKAKFPANPQATKGAKNTATGSRRILFDVMDSPPPRKRARGAPVEARVNLLEGAGHPEASETLDIPQLSDCWLATNPKEDISFDVKLHLSPAGKVEAAEIATVPMQMRACLTRAYLATPFVCDMAGEARVLHAGVTLSQRRNSALSQKRAEETADGHK